MFQPNYGIGNTKNNLEGLLKRCTSSNIWRLMNSDVAAQRRNLGVAIIYRIFKIINLALPKLRSSLPYFENERLNYSEYSLYVLCFWQILFFRSFYDMQVRPCAVAPPPGSTENATEKLMSFIRTSPHSAALPVPVFLSTSQDDKGCQAADTLD